MIEKNLFSFVKSCMINPVENMEKNTKTLKNGKKTVIFALILSFSMMLINLFTTMISSIFVRSCDFWTSKCKTKVIFENLGGLDYFELIVKYLFMYIIFALGVALIYHIVALLYKKNTSYIRVLAITLIAFIPSVVIGMIAAPILGIIYGPLSTFVSIGGSAYSILILIFTLKNELKLNDTDKLVLYSAICVVLLYILRYYMFTELVFI